MSETREETERRRDVLAALWNVSLFQGLGRTALTAVAALAEPIEIEAGTVLIRQGDLSRDLYVLRSGALAVYRADGAGPAVRQGEIGPGESVGEMAHLTRRPRSATVVAMRDCELIRLRTADLERLMEREPGIALGVARVLAQRLAVAQDARRMGSGPRTVAVVPHPTLSAERRAAFVQGLARSLASIDTCATLTAADAETARDRFQRLEMTHRRVLLVTDEAESAWSDFCLRQADIVLLVAEQDDDPARWPHRLPEGLIHRPETELALIGPEGSCAYATGRWLDLTDATVAHHVTDSDDLARLARLIARRAVTLVLSGGGARGFAHIGVVKALREAGVTFDIFGGASMGALIAAGYAAGWSHDDVIARVRETFCDRRLLNDPTFPVVSLFRGGRVETMLARAFGELAIEDLRYPYFCVSTDLTRGRPAVHRRGLVRRWLRASVAVPGILRPTTDGETMHVDGGVIDNLPVETALAGARGPVLGIDVGFDDELGVRSSARARVPFWQRWLGGRADGEPSILEILWRVGTIGNVSRGRREQNERLVLLRPPIDVGFLDWRALDRAVRFGHEHAVAALEADPTILEKLTGR